MDRKPQAGDVYDVRVTVIAVGAGSIDVDIVGCPSDYRSVFLLKDFTAHATLVKAAERPLAVGDMVRLPGWTDDAPPRPIAYIGGDFREAVVDLGSAGLSKPYRSMDLRRAETP